MENRLDEASSPYLRQHADNPVAWQPWDETALETAAERDVPIFLSIGYAACHWCHVMADESFDDPDTADVLNEHFVPIKVDREERPDVDNVYMQVCQMVRGSGGWPLSVWLTPEGKPFHVGTYFPPEPTKNTPGFKSVLEDIAEAWDDTERRQQLEQQADQWATSISSELEDTPEPVAEPPGEEFLDTAANAAVGNADREHGGWGRGQKFPHPGRIHLLLCAYQQTDRETYRDVAVETLDAMASGGLYDHVGGGFHRYCVDREWTVPHFEKMLYDNAEIPRAFLAGYQVTGDDRYAEIVAETFAFVDRELTHPDGGFYSTLDAESEDSTGTREEGAFYVWTPEVVAAAVDNETDAELFCERYGVTDAGNFENATTVLTESRPPEELAAERVMDTATVEERIERAREQLFESRAERSRPPRDEKVLAGWNGLMISALAEGALVLDPEYADDAAAALSFCREQLWDETEEVLNRRFEGGTVGIDGYLQDYAFLGRGALDLYQATGDVEQLSFALSLGRVIQSEFYDADAGTLYFTAEGGDSLLARPQQLADSSTPSSTGVAVELLSRLAAFDPDAGFDDVAETVIETHASTLESNPLSHTSLVAAAHDSAAGRIELTVAAADLPETWRTSLAETYLPGRLLSRRPPTDDGLDPWLAALDVDDVPPIWANRDAKDGEPTVYACRSFTCSPPKHDIDEAIEWL
ncbi:YyaL family protein [Natronomonas pharaonis DSM 2160]|uniref:YyaL family protein n=1 Tax=Natronomonas pharaonis (strain ATCC 35678 / DSM 2160 / CIP 103997 / JCM 8858 / NBRC 14720 / NCIMB 2260 / Gabara) TaxID=348780 RepID=A0A1U7EXX4_NATPD|nr:thioredoxin domain-containing protein [Natronomonas pharaonis]CAI50074.1 YyaL family protein [Natronomonas pharaonis DSM 2160]